jgi:hypothetical protein
MNRLAIPIALVVIILVALGIYLLTRKKNNNNGSGDGGKGNPPDDGWTPANIQILRNDYLTSPPDPSCTADKADCFVKAFISTFTFSQYTGGNATQDEEQKLAAIVKQCCGASSANFSRMDKSWMRARPSR